ncbi:MAG: hypothetical protein ACM3UW_04675 [Bacillota bacterium]
MAKDRLITPVVKWVGGERQIIDQRIEAVQAKRVINSKADGRGKIDEVWVMNFLKP